MGTSKAAGVDKDAGGVVSVIGCSLDVVCVVNDRKLVAGRIRTVLDVEAAESEGGEDGEGSLCGSSCSFSMWFVEV